MLDRSACPAPEQLQQFWLGELPAAEAALLKQHIDGCAACAGSVKALHDTPTSMTPPNLDGGGSDGNYAPTRVEAPAGLDVSSTPTTVLGQFDFLAPPEQKGEIGRLGPYRILKLLGEGGMGMVFQAQDPGLERLVALKVMKPEGASNEVARQRFMQEAKVAGALHHDHIVTIYNVGQDRGIPYLAMQFLQGEPLDVRLRREGRLPVLDVLRIGREVAEGLNAAHEHGLIHRDIKPANIWLERLDASKPPRVKILDFGLARLVGDNATNLTRTGVVMGTPDYMAPEQARSQALDFRCDLFSLGCVIYHMCTGKKPFHGDDVMSTLLSLTTEEPTPVRQLNPEVPTELANTIGALMAKYPGDRLQSARVAVDELSFVENRLRAAATAGVSAPEPYRGTEQLHPGLSGRRKRRTVVPDAPTPPLYRREGGGTHPTPPAAVDSKQTQLEKFGLASCDESDTDADADNPPGTAPLTPAAPSLLTKPPAAKDEAKPTACPRCGSKRYSSAGLGWCLACGYTPSFDKGATRKPSAPRGPGWALVLLGGIGLIVLQTYGGFHYLPRHSLDWTRWVWGQLIVGLAALIFAVVWTYIICWQFHDSSRSVLPLYATPIRLLTLAIKLLPRTRPPLCLGTWGMVAILGVGYVVGNPTYWWQRNQMRLALPMNDRVEMKTAKKIETNTRMRCVVLGFIPAADRTIGGVVLGEQRQGKLQYAGLAERTLETTNNEGIGQRLTRWERSTPPVSGYLNFKARWIEPNKVFCEVQYSDRDANGVLIDVVITAWD